MNLEEEFEHGGLYWIAPTHTHTERTPDWYWAVAVAAIIGVGLCVWLGDLLLALIIAIAAACLAMLASRYPRDAEIAITPHGISVDRQLYPFDTLHSFWIHEEHPVHPKLYVATHAILHPHIAIIIEEPAEPARVREYLLRYEVPEVEGHSLATFAAEVLGF